MQSQTFITPAQVLSAARELAMRARISPQTRIYGVPRGGVSVALALAGLTGAKLVSEPHIADLIVDDICDSGRTAERYTTGTAARPFEVLFDKRAAPWSGQWLVMPWEVSQDHDESASDAIVRLLQFIGEDPMREGLRDTPARVLRAFRDEWCSGYGKDPADVLKVFEDGAGGVDELIVQRNLPIFSLCEHHLAPFWGSAVIGYVPNGRIVGLSKLKRLVDIFARRLQVQERMTSAIADALMEHLSPLGVGVIVECRHMCMESRGVQTAGVPTTTSALRGVLFDDPRARSEFLALRAK